MKIWGLTGRRRRKTVLVVGTFRSGTNLLKSIIETNFDAEVVFSRWFWKHGVPPTSTSTIIPEHVPIVVMTKNPLDLNLSLHSFWQKRRPELNTSTNISKFIRDPFVVYDNTGGNIKPKYLFETPTAYWNQFNFSWLNWAEVDERRFFLRLEDLREDTDETIRNLSSQLEISATHKGPFELPRAPILPSQDGKTAQRSMSYKEGAASEKPIMSESDALFVKQVASKFVSNSLGYR